MIVNCGLRIEFGTAIANPKSKMTMNRRQFQRLLSGFFVVGGVRVKISQADDLSLQTEKPPVNLLAPTLGGKQFWTDELFFHEWHIQRNSFTGHCRLLDGHDFRHAWGSLEHCRARLEGVRREKSLPAMSGRAVIVLHGLMRSSSSMNGLAKVLRERGKFVTFNVSYPSTQGTVGDHATALAKVIASLEGVEEINFVAHSLGNLVVRHYLADQTDAATGRKPDPRIHRMIMLAPPNNGAQLAEMLLKNSIGSVVAGKSGQQIAREWQKLNERLATPDFEFGIIAGGRGQERGYNPLLTGDNDAIVSVETARLSGAADFAVLPALHTVIMDNPTVQEYTLRFLEHGYFVSPEARRPISRESK